MPRRAGQWIAVVRLVLAVVAVVDVSLTDFPPGYGLGAWVVAGFFAVSAVFAALSTRVVLDRRARVRVRALAIALDAATAVGFIAVFSYQSVGSSHCTALEKISPSSRLRRGR